MTWVMPWSSVYECVITNGLNETLPKASELVNLIVAVPRTNTSVERPFSAVKRIWTYHRRSQSKNILCGLAWTSIEMRVWWNQRHSLTAWQNLRTNGSKKWFKITNRSLNGCGFVFVYSWPTAWEALPLVKHTNYEVSQYAVFFLPVKSEYSPQCPVLSRRRSLFI